MSTISALLAQLEVAINAVEPRVTEDYFPGLTDAEIDVIMEGEPFDLPTDLRALYRGHNGKCIINFLGDYNPMLPLGTVGEIGKLGRFTLKDKSHYIREENRDHYKISEELPPFNLDEREFIYLFDGCGGDSIIAAIEPCQMKSCEIWDFDRTNWPVLLPMWKNTEAMLVTAIELWRNGVFESKTENSQNGWGLKTDCEKQEEISKRLNPNWLKSD